VARALSRGVAALVLGMAGLACAEPRFEVDGARAHRRVVFQVEAGSRVPGTPGHAKVVDWIAAELERAGARVERQRFIDSTFGTKEELVNVIGHFGAPRPNAAHGPFVLCAHYDSRPFADQDPDPARRQDPVPAANDGGSGVSVLLEIADLMAKQPAPCPVDLVFLDGEDQGKADAPETFCRGSRGYAARLGTPKPRGAILFDMVGGRDLAIYTEGFSLERANNLTDLVLEAARAVHAPHFHPQTRYHVVDDHIPLLDAGVPAVDLIDFDYSAWHTTHDLPDQVSPESLAEVARVAAWLVYRSPLARLP
jgi:acetylornithine deacetylase/succinyl-diaminopimelate desuccinylase-like protein